MEPLYDTIIVGASLAGSSLALQLSRQGKKIALVDAEHFPRRKICGEGLSGRGVQLLSELGVSLEKFPCKPISGFLICDGDQQSILPPQKPPGTFVIGSKREDLDERVFIEARSAPGVHARLGFKVIEIQTQENETQVSLSDGKTFSGKRVVLAVGGRSSLLRKCLSRGSQNRYGISFHCRVSSENKINHVHIFLEPEVEVYVTPVASNLINIALLASKSKFSLAASPLMLEELISRLEKLWSLCLTKTDDYLYTGPFGDIRRSTWDSNVFLVGDAVEQFDPIGGMGMTHALLSSKILAEELVREELAPLNPNQRNFNVQTRYEKRRSREARLYRGFTRLTYYSLIKFSHLSGVRKLRNSRVSQLVSEVVHDNQVTSFSSHLTRAIVSGIGALRM